ncbi:hypothetical protein [Martelella mediterranea]|uniref:Uncharacterized protein n=1 Tax=Martelella mediterranea TaxID=293089 RepID=A0A4R3NIS7_9HYPH|nr:hypothetical protein [Martelella mediterranea]TCT34621.1 hypothetical protein EDC90_103315 [Martelella mediterranea]
MSVHYDVEETLQAMRAKMAEHQPGERSTVGTHIRFRNPEASIELRRLILGEMNRGTEVHHIIEALGEIFATIGREISLMGRDPDVAREIIGNLFIAKLEDQPDITIPVPVSKQHGGHA